MHPIGQESAVLPAHRRRLNLEKLEERLLLSGLTMYVDDDFTPATPGWGVDHFDQIQDGIDAAGTDDTVMVAEGTYNENISIDSDHDGLTLQGAGALVTIIDGGGGDTVVELDDFDGGTISGFTIRNGSAAEGGGINCGSSNSTITSCIITGNDASLNGGGIYVGGGAPTIVNNAVTDNTAMFGAANYMNGASPTFANNTIYGNTAGSCGGALYAAESVFTMANCILWNNESSPLFPNDEIMLRSDSDLTIRYSIIMDGDDEIFAWMGADFSYNSTNSDSNPKLVAAGSGDFRLQADSPGIDAANGDAAPTTDFDGNPRFDDPLTTNEGVGTPDYADIGAFEFVDGASNDPPTVASLDVAPDPVTRPDDLTLTALGVDDPDGSGTVAAVEFYHDVNSNGTLEPGTDLLLGTDTNATDGWSWTGSSGGLPAGSSQTFFARARDNYSAHSDAVSTAGTVLNAAPTIDSLTDWLAGGNVTLTAHDVSDDDVSKVAFYLDANGDGVLQEGTDTYLGDGSQSSPDWQFGVDVSGWADDTYTFFARAQDSDSEWSNAVSTEVLIGQRYVGRIDDPISDAYVDVYAREDLTLGNVQVSFSGGAVSSLKLTGEESMYGLGLLIHSEPFSQTASSIKDSRKGVKGDLAFIASDAPIKSIKLKSAMTGYDLNGLTLGGLTFDDDIDGDGDETDATAIYGESAVGSVKVDGGVTGDVWVEGFDSRGRSLKLFSTKYAGFHGDLVATHDVSKISLGGDFGSSIQVGGSLGSLKIKAGDLEGEVHVAGTVGKISVSRSKSKLTSLYAGGSVTADASIVVAGQDSKGRSLKSLSVKGGNFAGLVDVAGDLSKLHVRARDGIGGHLLAGARIGTGGRLGKLSVGGSVVGGAAEDELVQVCARSIGKVDVKGSVQGSRILAGADLGDDWALGGAGEDADTFIAGSIDKFSVRGNVTDTLIGAGLITDPGGLLDLGWLDAFIDQCRIGSVSIKGTLKSSTGLGEFGIGAYQIDKVSVGDAAEHPLVVNEV